MEQADLLVIGGGIVGLATAFLATQRFPSWRIVLLEKESQLVRHQTGRNSGVLHSGIYYRPGSLKALNCREGKHMMEEFCRSENLPIEICGKVIVATCEAEQPALHSILQRGQANGVKCRLVDRAELTELEPHVRGVEAIHVPETGILDFSQICERLAIRMCEHGARIVCSAEVISIKRQPHGQLIVISAAGDFTARRVVNCAGLYSDRVVRSTGDVSPAQIIPFRGEYFKLTASAEHLCRNLIYPVPSPDFPFLGVHFTRMIHGGVECGPNAVLALAREGYFKLDFQLKELAEMLRFAGFWKLFLRHWKTGLAELWRSFSKQAFVAALQELVPEITANHLEPAPAGVRAQAVSRDGGLVDDFLLVESKGAIHVCNAPSPAATSSLRIARSIVDRLANNS